MGVEEKQGEIKKKILDSTQAVLGKKKQENRKQWISQVMAIIKERRQYKNSKYEEGIKKYQSRRNKIVKKAKLENELNLREAYITA